MAAGGHPEGAPHEPRRPAHALLWTWLLVLLAMAVAAVVMVVYVSGSGSSTAPLGLVITLPFIWLGLVFLGGVATLVLVLTAERNQPLVLSVSLVPLIVAVSSLALPEALKHNYPRVGDLPLIGASLLAVAIGALLGLGIAIPWRAPRRSTVLIAALASAGAWALFGGPFAARLLASPSPPECATSRFDEARWKDPGSAKRDPDGDGLTVREEIGRVLSYCGALRGLNRDGVRARLGPPDEVRRREWLYAVEAGRPGDGARPRKLVVRFRHPARRVDRVRLVPGDDSP